MIFVALFAAIVMVLWSMLDDIAPEPHTINPHVPTGEPSMNDFRDEVKFYSPLLLVVLAAFVFAVTPLVIYLNKTKEYTKRGLFVTGIQSAWILLVNILCALGSLDYLLEHYGRTNGVILMLLFAAFGGTVALGLYEVVLNQRLAIGRKIEQKVLSFLTTPKEEENTDEKS